MNPIGWCDRTINIITGCNNGCPYCYARKMANRLRGRFGYPVDEPFRPTFHPDKIQDVYNLRGAGKRIFLDSMGDWFSDGVVREWIRRAVNVVATKPNHTFLVLTKRPDQMAVLRDLDIPKNLWFGVSVTNQNNVWRIEEILHKSYIPKDQRVFVSFEPLHGPISCNLTGIDWVIIGAESGNRKGKIVPEVEWIDRICGKCRSIPVYMKDNLRPAIEDSRGLIQEFSVGM